MQRKYLTYRDYSNALHALDGVNLTAITKEFAEIISAIHNECGGETEKVWNHPISVLFAEKIYSLTKADRVEVFSRAYKECKRVLDTTRLFVDGMPKQEIYDYFEASPKNDMEDLGDGKTGSIFYLGTMDDPDVGIFSVTLTKSFDTLEELEDYIDSIIGKIEISSRARDAFPEFDEYKGFR
jgi:hypothetical protein